MQTETALPEKKRHGRNQFSREGWEQTPYSLKYIQAKTMLDQGKGYDAIVAATGLSSATISKVKKGIIEISPSWVKTLKSVESTKLTLLIHQLLDSVTPEKIAASSATQIFTSAAILLDKRRLIDGESSAIIMHADLISTLAEDRNTLMRQLNSIDKISTLPTENGNASLSRDNEC